MTPNPDQSSPPSSSVQSESTDPTAPNQSSNDQPAIRGVLNINKPYGYNSTRICRIVKGRLKSGGAPKRVKVGHGGTLDPLASGVLVILIGKATKQQDHIMGLTKGYKAVVDLAHTSESCDREHEAIPSQIDKVPTLDEIQSVIDTHFVGQIEQVPPLFSAVWVDGKRAYHLARQGVEVELKPRTITIDSIDIIKYDWPFLEIDIICSKGTYIRSLARDIGAQLNVGGMLDSLVRTKVGDYTLENALDIDDVVSPLDPWSLPLPLSEQPNQPQNNPE